MNEIFTLISVDYKNEVVTFHDWPSTKEWVEKVMKEIPKDHEIIVLANGDRGPVHVIDEWAVREIEHGNE